MSILEEFKISKVSIQPKMVERKIKMQRKRGKQRQTFNRDNQRERHKDPTILKTHTESHKAPTRFHLVKRWMGFLHHMLVPWCTVLSQSLSDSIHWSLTRPLHLWALVSLPFPEQIIWASVLLTKRRLAQHCTLTAQPSHQVFTALTFQLWPVPWGQMWN